MNHLENLVCQYYQWKGYIVLTNIKVGKLPLGGWEGELDIVAYSPQKKIILHIEPSLDALSWKRREARCKKKFEAGRKYIYKEVLTWLKQGESPITQIAILAVSANPQRSKIAGGSMWSVDQFIKMVSDSIKEKGKAGQNAIPENYDLLRTLQLALRGYHGLAQTSPPQLT